MAEEPRFQVEYERLRAVFQHAPLTLSVTVVNSTLVALVLGRTDGKELFFGWVAAIVVVSAVRWVGSRRFLRRRPDERSCRRWGLFSVFGSLTTGILWGLTGTVMFPASEAHRLFLALVIGGMCAGSVTVNASHMRTVLAFIIPSSLPLAACFFAQGTEWQVSALMIIVFVVALVATTFQAHRAFGDHVELRVALGLEQRKLSETNQQLMHEVAQRRTAEATLHQAQKMEAIGHLTGGIAHDFNNLLQVIIGNTDLIRRSSVDNARISKYAQAAEQAALRGADLASSLLTFARRQTLEAEPVDINALLREFDPILQRTLGAMINFEMVLSPDLPKCLADPAHFQSAVLNLVINARDAMPDGGVVSVTSGLTRLEPDDLVGNPDAQPGQFVSVSVRDTGVGMSPEVLARVFDPFFTTKGIGKGTGLGLSQVYGFARQSGGHIALVSKQDHGTEATLSLPIVTADISPGAAGQQRGGPPFDGRSAAG